MTTPANFSHSKENNTDTPASILVYGYGNPGRQDDGAGPACIEALEQWATSKQLDHLAFESNYQLNAEDALAIAGYRIVIFIDATSWDEKAFAFQPLAAQATIAFSTHAMTPESVLALCEELYNKRPTAYLLSITGVRWEPNDPMSPEAQSHLTEALHFIKPLLEHPELIVRL